MANNNTYKRPVIVWGNSFYINIALERFNEGTYENFDLTKVTDLKVSLICATHNTVIPLEYEIIPDIDNVLRCFVDYRLLHTTSYGIVVEGYDEHDIHFRFSMLPKEGFLVVNNTSGMEITDEVQTIDISGRVGWGISTTGDLTNYYTKTEVDNIIAGIEVEIGDTYTKEEVNQLLTQYPTKTEINTRFNDYYTKTQTNNLLNQKANKSELATVATTGDYNDLTNKPIIPEQVQSDWNETNTSKPDYIKNKPNLNNYATKSDLNNYYDKGQTDGMLNNKVDTSTLVSEYYNKNTVNNLLDTKADTSDLNDFYDKQETNTLLNQKANVTDLNNKQDTLVSGTNIKTINNQSILGSGNIDIQGGGTQEQADWSQTDTTAVDYIKNKPDLSIYAETSDLATVATTGDYDDLTNKPDLSIYATQSDLNDKQDTLVSGTNIKTINSQSILGSGNIEIQGGGDPDAEEVTANALYELNEELNYTKKDIEAIPSVIDSKLDEFVKQVDASIEVVNNSMDDLSASITNTDINNALILVELHDEIGDKQDTLVSGTNIKTINSQSILGNGDLTIGGGVQSDWNETDTTSLAYIQNKPTIPAEAKERLLINYNIDTVNDRLYLNLCSITADGSIYQPNLLKSFTSMYTDIFTNKNVYYSIWVDNTLINTTDFNNAVTRAGRDHYLQLPATISNVNINYGSEIIFCIGNRSPWSGDPYQIISISLICNKLISSSTKGLKIEIVNALPASTDPNTIYIIQ